MGLEASSFHPDHGSCTSLSPHRDKFPRQSGYEESMVSAAAYNYLLQGSWDYHKQVVKAVEMLMYI